MLNYHFHPTQKMKQLDSGNVQVKFTSGGTYAICQELFKWGCDVKIKKPVELKKYYKQYYNLTDKFESGNVGIICALFEIYPLPLF